MDNLLQALLAPDQPKPADLTPGTPAFDLYLKRRAAMEQTARAQGLSEIPPWMDELAKQQALQDSGVTPKADGAPYAPPDPATMNLGMGMPSQTAAIK